MPYSGDVRLDNRVAKLEAAILGAQFLCVRTTIDVYGRGKGDKPVLLESRPDLTLLIDPLSGWRCLRSEAKDVELFDELCADARLIERPITCHEKQLPALLDDTSEVVGVLSGNRAGKTQILAFRLFRRWMLRGGPGHKFWWLAPSWKKTEIGVKKLCVGGGGLPPVFPPELILSFPKNCHQAEQVIEVIDGSQVEMYQCGGDGSNLKGDAVWDIFIDELTSIKHRENWTIALARLLDHDGTISAASTPVAGHWSRADIVARALRSKFVSHYEFSCFDNPWVTEGKIERLIQTSGGHKDPQVRRNYYGEWVVDGTALWPKWKPEDHLVQDHDIISIHQLAGAGFIPAHYVDVTARAVSGFWRDRRGKAVKGARVCIGQDFNLNPMSSVVAKVFGDPADRSTWGLFFFDEVLSRGTVQDHCVELSRKYAGAPVSCDATGALTGTHPSQGSTGNTTNRSEMERLGFHAEACHRRAGVSRNPSVIDNLNLVYRLQGAKRIIVHARCDKLCEALDTQKRAWDGKIEKQPNTASDRLSGPSDAMRYLIWSLFYEELRDRPDGEIEEEGAQDYYS